MNEEEQRIAIAEACGWTKLKPYLGGLIGYDAQVQADWNVPDYLNDLNAMHEAIKILSQAQMSDFFNKVCRLVNTTTAGEEVDMFATCNYHEIAAIVFCIATSAQRAEAFLRTLNLWKE